MGRVCRHLTCERPLLVTLRRLPHKPPKIATSSDLTQKSPNLSVLTPVREPCPALPIYVHAVFHTLIWIQCMPRTAAPLMPPLDLNTATKIAGASQLWWLYVRQMLNCFDETRSIRHNRCLGTLGGIGMVLSPCTSKEAGSSLLDTSLLSWFKVR